MLETQELWKTLDLTVEAQTEWEQRLARKHEIQKWKNVPKDPGSIYARVFLKNCPRELPWASIPMHTDPYAEARAGCAILRDVDLARLASRAGGLLVNLRLKDFHDTDPRGYYVPQGRNIYVTAECVQQILASNPRLQNLHLRCGTLDVSKLTLPPGCVHGNVTLYGCRVPPATDDSILDASIDLVRCESCKHAAAQPLYTKNLPRPRGRDLQKFQVACRRCGVKACQWRFRDRGEDSDWGIGCCFEKLAECPNCSFRLCPDCDDRPGCFHCGARTCQACVPEVFAACCVPGCSNVGCGIENPLTQALLEIPYGRRVGSNCASALRCHGCDGDMCVECVPKSKKCVECGQDYCAQCAKHPMLATACGFCDAFVCSNCVEFGHGAHEYDPDEPENVLITADPNEVGGSCHGCDVTVCAKCCMRPDCCGGERVYCPDCKCPDANVLTGPFPQLPVRNEAAKRLGLPHPIRCLMCNEAVCSDCCEIEKCSHCGQEQCGRAGIRRIHYITGEKIIDANHTAHRVASKYINCEMDRCQKCSMLVCAECMEDGDPDVSLCGRCVGRAECELCEE